MLASADGHVIHFALDEVNILSGVGKGVIGIKLDDDDDCLGGVLIGGRFDKLVVETESGKTQEFGRGAIKTVDRGGKGDEAGRADRVRRAWCRRRSNWSNWDEVEGKAEDEGPRTAKRERAAVDGREQWPL